MTKVLVIETERGWGSKVDEVKQFDTYEKAEEFVKEYNSYNTKKEVPDWYWYWYMYAKIDGK